MLLSLIKIFVLCLNVTHFGINFLTHFIIKYYCPFLRIRNKEIRKFVSFRDLMRSPICNELDSFKSKLSKLTKAGKYSKFVKYEMWDMTNRDSADLKEIPQIKEIPVQIFFSEFYDIVYKGFFLQNTSKWLLPDCVVKARDYKVIWVFFHKFLFILIV